MANTYNVQIEDSEGNKYCPKPDLLTTKEQVSANTASGKSVDALVIKGLNNDLKSSFQAGVDALHSKCVSCGATPSAKTPAAISTSIGTIHTNRYNEGYSAGNAAGYNAGRTQGQNDVKANPGAYGIKTSKNYTVTMSMPWSSSYAKSGTISVTIKIVDGKINSISHPGRITISSDGNFVDFSSSATIVEN